jgi:hypothetical protein
MEKSFEFKVGQVLNSQGQGVYGKLIGWRNALRYGRKHNWTHSAIITEVAKDKVLVFEALSKGFVSNYYEKKWLENKITEGFYVIGETKRPLKEVHKYANKYRGTGYGYLDIFHILLYWVFGSRSKILSTNARALICSEAVARILYDASDKEINFEKEFEIPYDLIEPMHLWHSTHNKWFNFFTLKSTK